MPVDYRYRKGTDMPSWHWLSPFPPGASQPGTANSYDGRRYIYWAIQSGTATAGTASTTTLYRYDTWTNGWQYIVNLTSTNRGLEIEYDAVRNVLWIAEGNATTPWRYYNLNNVGVTLLGITTAAWTLSAVMGTALPAAAGEGSSFSMPDSTDVGDPLYTSAAAGVPTTTTIPDALGAESGHSTAITGAMLVMTSGTQAGVGRVITAVDAVGTFTTAAFPGAPAAGNTFEIRSFAGTATGGTATTLTMTGAGWPVNSYGFMDVEITAGLGAGQRRRVASNTVDTLTLAGSTAGNARTGNWTTTPDNTSVFRIIPSQDFLYYQAGGATGWYRVDVAATAIAWTTLTALPAVTGGGSNVMWMRYAGPDSFIALRGVATATVYRYHVGTNAWVTLTTPMGSENFSTGACSTFSGAKRRMFIQKEAQPRVYSLNPTTGLLDSAGLMPYVAPGAADGKRMRFIRTADGVDWLYVLRASGQEFYRVPLEWI